MRLLLDTHLLVWTTAMKVPELGRSMRDEALTLIQDELNELYFSPVNVWEVAIKNALGRADFRVDPHLFRRGLLDHGYIELPITSEHAAAVASLPAHHRDPFDRILIAQATVEGITLLTNDSLVARYPGPVRKVESLC